MKTIKIFILCITIFSACKKKTAPSIEVPTPIVKTYVFKLYNMKTEFGSNYRQKDDDLIIKINRVRIMVGKDTCISFDTYLHDTVSIYWYPGFAAKNKMRISLDDRLLIKYDSLCNTNFTYTVK